MRKLVMLALLVVALGTMTGAAMAEHGGEIPPIRAMSWGGAR